MKHQHLGLNWQKRGFNWSVEHQRIGIYHVLSSKSHILTTPGRNAYTSTVLKSHQAGKVTSSPWHGGDTEKSHQVVESHIREEESPWHSLFHPYLEM
jgi:hypothetical protein